jgi:hypothetical protein
MGGNGDLSSFETSKLVKILWTTKFWGLKTHQWYQSSHKSHPTIGDPSSTLPQPGQIQIRFPSSSWT